MRVLGIVGSPSVGGRTDAAVAGVLAGCAERQGVGGGEVAVEQLSLADTAVPAVLAAMERADAIVFGSPTYRASYSSLLKDLLEQTERGRYASETTAPLRGTTAAIVMTANAPEHFLAQDSLRGMLAGFFGVQVLSPGLALGHGAFAEDGGLTGQIASLAALHGRALVDLAAAVRASEALQALAPQV